MNEITKLFEGISNSDITLEMLQAQKIALMKKHSLSEEDFECFTIYASMIMTNNSNGFRRLEALANKENTIAAGIVANIYWCGLFGISKQHGIAYNLLRQVGFDGSKFPFIWTISAFILAVGVPEIRVVANTDWARARYQQAALAGCHEGRFWYGMCLMRGDCNTVINKASGLKYLILGGGKSWRIAKYIKNLDKSDVSALKQCLQDADFRKKLYMKKNTFDDIINMLFRIYKIQTLSCRDPRNPIEQAKFINAALVQFSKVYQSDMPDFAIAELALLIEDIIATSKYAIAQNSMLLALWAYQLLSRGDMHLHAEQHAWLVRQLISNGMLASLIEITFDKNKDKGQSRLRNLVIYHYQQYREQAPQDELYSAVQSFFEHRGDSRHEAGHFGVVALPLKESKDSLEQEVKHSSITERLDIPQKVGWMPIPHINHPILQHFIPYWIHTLDVSSADPTLGNITKRAKPIFEYLAGAKYFTNYSKMCNKFCCEVISFVINYKSHDSHDFAQIQSLLWNTTHELLDKIKPDKLLMNYIRDFMLTLAPFQQQIRNLSKFDFDYICRQELGHLRHSFNNAMLQSICQHTLKLCDLARSPTLTVIQKQTCNKFISSMCQELTKCDEDNEASLAALQHNTQQALDRAEPILSRVSTIWYVLSGLMQALFSLTIVGACWVYAWRDAKRVGSSSPVFFANTEVDRCMEIIENDLLKSRPAL